MPLEPLYRSTYPDGSTLDVHADVDTMTDEVARVCGAEEAAGYRRYVDFVSKLYKYEMNDFIDRNIDSPLSLMLSSGGFTHIAEAKAAPVHLLESGPAAGALAAAHLGKGEARLRPPTRPCARRVRPEPPARVDRPGSPAPPGSAGPPARR